MRLTVPVFILFTSATIRASPDTRACYSVSNSIAPNQHPCISPTTQSISHCCSTTDTCLGDTLCLSQFGTLYVGSCTIKDWKDGANGKGSCPKYCANEGYDIGLCSFNNGWDFCCGLLGKGNEEYCKGERFKLDGNTTSEFVVQRPWGVDAVSEGSASTSSTMNPTASSVSSQCPTLPANATDDGRSEDDEIPVSQIGLGVGLGIPLLIALGLLFWENRKRRLVEARLEMSRGELVVGHAGYAASNEGKPGTYVGVESHEVDGLEQRNELSSDRPLYELAHGGR